MTYKGLRNWLNNKKLSISLFQKVNFENIIFFERQSSCCYHGKLLYVFFGLPILLLVQTIQIYGLLLSRLLLIIDTFIKHTYTIVHLFLVRHSVYNFFVNFKKSQQNYKTSQTGNTNFLMNQGGSKTDNNCWQMDILNSEFIAEVPVISQVP